MRTMECNGLFGCTIFLRFIIITKKDNNLFGNDFVIEYDINVYASVLNNKILHQE